MTFMHCVYTFQSFCIILLFQNMHLTHSCLFYFAACDERSSLSPARWEAPHGTFQATDPRLENENPGYGYLLSGLVKKYDTTPEEVNKTYPKCSIMAPLRDMGRPYCTMSAAGAAAVNVCVSPVSTANANDTESDEEEPGSSSRSVNSASQHPFNLDQEMAQKLVDEIVQNAEKRRRVLVEADDNEAVEELS